jgi:hypothetical protein
MQKSASPPPADPKGQSARFDPGADKGQKFEPFHSPAPGRDRRSVARELQLDRKR